MVVGSEPASGSWGCGCESRGFVIQVMCQPSSNKVHRSRCLPPLQSSVKPQTAHATPQATTLRWRVLWRATVTAVMTMMMGGRALRTAGGTSWLG